ncbi:hypothetical protein [Nonomuraea roseola]|uniref:DUF4440 domain-containing protein n=1 Tax=Nonomuraea roseola TaxID=46179 RepID=A0ABV5PRY7_9ACTN
MWGRARLSVWSRIPSAGRWRTRSDRSSPDHGAREPGQDQGYGDTALFTGRVTNTAHHLGRRFDADEWTTDVFVRRQGRWLCVLSHITAAATA